MDIYKEMTAMGCFTLEDIVRVTGSESSAAWQIKKYLGQGYIERVRRDLYVAISLETACPVLNRYQIATKAADDACISHHSAFEFYGYGNQVFHEIYFISGKRVRPFSYDGYDFRPLSRKGESGIVETDSGVRITSIERTVIDSISDFEKVTGLEEILRCIDLIPSLDYNKLLEALEMHGHEQLYQKAGYILESFNDNLNLPEEFFDECVKRSSDSKTYLFDKQDNFIYHPKWKLYAPANLREVIDKGVPEIEEI